MSSMLIGGRSVGAVSPTLVIAEIGVNHDGSLSRALRLVEHAAQAGADAVKLQVFRAASLMHSTSQFADYQQARCADADPATMLRRYELSHESMREIVAAVRELGMLPIATPFSPDDVDACESLDLAAIKIASPDLVNRVLLHRAARTGRPLLVSTGAATALEVTTTTAWLREWGASYALLHCVSSYPTPLGQSHLCWIGELSCLGVPVGYSDHTTETLAGALAVAAGACIVEKHITYDRSAAGPDHAASADPQQFAEYVRHVRLADAMR